MGEAPGATEELEGKPFVGQSGKTLDKWLNSIGLDRSSLYITNVVKVKLPDNRKPTKEELKYWTPILVDELKDIDPHLIITVGQFAANAVLENKTPISKLRGISHFLTTFGNYCIVTPIYHPSYVRINPSTEDIVVKDLAVIQGIAESLTR